MSWSANEMAHMRRAIQLAGCSVSEPGRGRPSPSVGAVLIGADGELLGEGYRGATGDGDHAEYGILKRLGSHSDLTGATIYTTLEPCSKRGPSRVPCAQRLADARISSVVIGAYDPDPRIHQDGWRILRDAGVVLRDFPVDLRQEIADLNRSFVDQFRVGHGDHGTARFDYRQNDGCFLIADTSVGIFETAWSGASAGAVYAYDNAQFVSVHRYARAFAEIDDPSAYPFETYAVPVGEGQIAIFRNGTGWLLVKVEDVKAADRGDESWELTISWEARAVENPHSIVSGQCDGDVSDADRVSDDDAALDRQ